MKSMTGMGRAKGLVLGQPVRIEIKTVNHRYCDINFKAPLRYAMLEFSVQQCIKKVIARGHVDVFVFEDKVPQLSQTEMRAFKLYHQYLQGVQKELGLTDPIKLDHLLGGAHAWTYTEQDSKTMWTDLEAIIKSALHDLNGMREVEGKQLKQYLKDDFVTIDKISKDISGMYKQFQQELETKIKERISDRIKEFKDLDSQRLHSEVVYYLDKMDIAEELGRVESHLKRVGEFLENPEPMGRKIDFLLQEFLREFNTIGSKCSHVQISHLVVEAKATLEKIREQAMNVE